MAVLATLITNFAIWAIAVPLAGNNPSLRLGTAAIHNPAARGTA